MKFSAKVLFVLVIVYLILSMLNPLKAQNFKVRTVEKKIVKGRFLSADKLRIKNSLDSLIEVCDSLVLVVDALQHLAEYPDPTDKRSFKDKLTSTKDNLVMTRNKYFSLRNEYRKVRLQKLGLFGVIALEAVGLVLMLI